MARPRPTYTAEYELAAVKVITAPKLSAAGAARRPDVGENLPRARRKAFEEGGGAALPGPGNPPPADGESRRLRAAHARLRAARDRLGTAAAPSARPPT